jgi:hypothetical protein
MDRSRCFTFQGKNKAHRDRQVPKRKRTVKEYRLMRNMPKGAAIAIAMWDATMK